MHVLLLSSIPEPRTYLAFKLKIQIRNVFMNSNHNHPVPEDWGRINLSGLVYYKAILFPFEGDASSVRTPSTPSFQNVSIFPFSVSCTVSHICHVIHFHGGKKKVEIYHQESFPTEMVTGAPQTRDLCTC